MLSNHMEPQKHKPKHTKTNIENKKNSTSLQQHKGCTLCLIITLPEQYKLINKRSELIHIVTDNCLAKWYLKVCMNQMCITEFFHTGKIAPVAIH